jgi:DNA-binding NarL/FixJ family response regulator
MPEKMALKIKEFVAKGFPCKVLILSSHDDLRIIKEVMKLGCSGYLTKKMRMKTSLKPYMLFLEEKNIFAKRFEKKYLIPLKDN